MICYKDRTFCISDCQKNCKLKLTEEIKHEAEGFGLPISIAVNLCGKEEKENDK